MLRRPTAELLDTDAGTPAEIAGSLEDLRGINRRFGGVSTSEMLVRLAARQLNQTHMSLLEVAAGSGYVPATVKQRLEKHGIELDVTLLDRAPSHLGTHANNGGPGGPAGAGIKAVVGDALALPFHDSSFDLVSCNLFAHHLAPKQLVDFAREALRVCRGAILINDLVRDPVHLALAYAAFPLFHSRITRHDSVASVRQAYTTPEMLAMLQSAGAARVEIYRHFLYRMGVIAWK